MLYVFKINDSGYILELHRIPPKNNKQQQSKVVFLQHGLFATSQRWVRGNKEKKDNSLSNLHLQPISKNHSTYF